METDDIENSECFFFYTLHLFPPGDTNTLFAWVNLPPYLLPFLN